MEFKDRLLQARKEKGLSQEALAEIIGVSRQAVSKWETGEAMPETDKLVTLCHALDLDMEYLALGKASLPHSQKGNILHGRITALLIGICLLAGFFVGFLLGRGSSSQQADSLLARQKLELLEAVTISDVTVSRADNGMLEFAILPSILPEGVTVQVLCEDQILGTADTFVCTFDGIYYRFLIETDGIFQYRITVQLALDGFTKQLPLIDLNGDTRSYSYVHRYEKQ